VLVSELVIRHDVAGLCTLTLNRAHKLNALNTEMFEELDAHLAAIENDAATGCVVVRGAGKAFCAGADLEAMGKPTGKPPTFKPGVIERLSALPQPVVAAVRGVCYTGGLELALSCDLIVADPSAVFADTHGKWGLVGAWGMSQRLPRRIGAAAAKYMMLTSRSVAAAEAQTIGLVDILAPRGGLDEAIGELTRQILANSAFTNVATKRLLRQTDGMSLGEGLAHERHRAPGVAPDHKERLARFAPKTSSPD
jgi:enoyl-CoA hydratase/carnithine racemase